MKQKTCRDSRNPLSSVKKYFRIIVEKHSEGANNKLYRRAVAVCAYCGYNVDVPLRFTCAQPALLNTLRKEDDIA